MWYLGGKAHLDGVEGQLLNAVHDGVLSVPLYWADLKYKAAVMMRVHKAAAPYRRGLQAHQRVQRLLSPTFKNSEAQNSWWSLAIALFETKVY